MKKPMTAALMLSLMQYYAQKRKTFQEFLNIIAYDYDIAYVHGKVKNRLAFEYSIHEGYQEQKRNRYGTL